MPEPRALHTCPHTHARTHALMHARTRGTHSCLYVHGSPLSRFIHARRGAQMRSSMTQVDGQSQYLMTTRYIHHIYVHTYMDKLHSTCVRVRVPRVRYDRFYDRHGWHWDRRICMRVEFGIHLFYDECEVRGTDCSIFIIVDTFIETALVTPNAKKIDNS